MVVAIPIFLWEDFNEIIITKRKRKRKECEVKLKNEDNTKKKEKEDINDEKKINGNADQADQIEHEREKNEESHQAIWQRWCQ